MFFLGRWTSRSIGLLQSRIPLFCSYLYWGHHNHELHWTCGDPSESILAIHHAIIIIVNIDYRYDTVHSHRRHHAHQGSPLDRQSYSVSLPLPASSIQSIATRKHTSHRLVCLVKAFAFKAVRQQVTIGISIYDSTSAITNTQMPACVYKGAFLAAAINAISLPKPQKKPASRLGRSAGQSSLPSGVSQSYCHSNPLLQFHYSRGIPCLGAVFSFCPCRGIPQ